LVLDRSGVHDGLGRKFMGTRRTSLAAAAVLGVGWTAIGGWTPAEAAAGSTL
jgi:hypothetical protein